MRGKRPSLYANLYFFFFESHKSIVRLSLSSAELLHENQTACHCHPLFVTLYISRALCYLKGSQPPTWSHINTDLSVRCCTLKPTHGCTVLCVCLCYDRNGLACKSNLLRRAENHFYLWQCYYSSFLFLRWTQGLMFHSVVYEICYCTRTGECLQ